MCILSSRISSDNDWQRPHGAWSSLSDSSLLSTELYSVIVTDIISR